MCSILPIDLICVCGISAMRHYGGGGGGKIRCEEEDRILACVTSFSPLIIHDLYVTYSYYSRILLFACKSLWHHQWSTHREVPCSSMYLLYNIICILFNILLFNILLSVNICYIYLLQIYLLFKNIKNW